MSALRASELAVQTSVRDGMRRGQDMFRSIVATLVGLSIIGLYREAASERTRLELLEEVAHEEEQRAKRRAATARAAHPPAKQRGRTPQAASRQAGGTTPTSSSRRSLSSSSASSSSSVVSAASSVASPASPVSTSGARRVAAEHRGEARPRGGDTDARPPAATPSTTSAATTAAVSASVPSPAAVLGSSKPVRNPPPSKKPADLRKSAPSPDVPQRASSGAHDRLAPVVGGRKTKAKLVASSAAPKGASKAAAAGPRAGLKGAPLADSSRVLTTASLAPFALGRRLQRHRGGGQWTLQEAVAVRVGDEGAGACVGPRPGGARGCRGRLRQVRCAVCGGQQRLGKRRRCTPTRRVARGADCVVSARQSRG